MGWARASTWGRRESVMWPTQTQGPCHETQHMSLRHRSIPALHRGTDTREPLETYLQGLHFLKPVSGSLHRVFQRRAVGQVCGDLLNLLHHGGQAVQ